MRPCRRWTEAEDALIAAEYATANLDELAVRMNRTVKAIRKHAQDMGVVRPHSGNNGKKFPNRKRPIPAGGSQGCSRPPKSIEALHSIFSSWAHA